MKNKVLIILVGMTSIGALSIAMGCSDTHLLSKTEVQEVKRNLNDTGFSFTPENSKTRTIKMVEVLQQTEDIERLKLECDQKNLAMSCYLYASYQNYIEDNYSAYQYYLKSYNLGELKSGTHIARYQINYPELFDEDTLISIDENINYLEESLKAGSYHAATLLMTIYMEPKFNRVDYKKAEYYGKIAVEQNSKYSRGLLASLYIMYMKDKSKIEESIALLKKDLIIEKNWTSAFQLFAIYLYPNKYGADFEVDVVKPLAYAYVSRNLRQNNFNGDFNDVDIKFINIIEKDIPADELKEAKNLYHDIMAEMNR